jgi:hypothetical protein
MKILVPVKRVVDYNVKVRLGLFDACHRPQECEYATARCWQASNEPRWRKPRSAPMQSESWRLWRLIGRDARQC